MCDENLPQERRRSARIIALEERKENEIKALPAAITRNESQNLQDTKRDKGKKVIDVDDDDFFMDSDYEDELNVSTRKRGRKHKALDQLISPTQQGGQCPETTATARRTGIYDLNDMPEKQVFEAVIDALQRKDPHDYFGVPVNANEVLGYYDKIKQPMDFGTMRAKLHENIYTTLEELEHDVRLMCNNAMTFNAKSSMYHRVASTIHDKARSIFVSLRANPENIDLDALRNKRSRGVVRPRGRPCRVAQLPGEHDEESDGVQHELEERRFTDSPASQALRGPKQNFELNEPRPSNEESVNHFSQEVAGKELTTLELHLNLSGQTASPSQNHPTPQEGNYGAGADGDGDHNKNTGTTIEHGARVRDKGKAICLDACDYQATAAALLGTIFLNYEQGESSRAHHVEASNITRPLNIDLNTDPSMDPMVPTLENEASIQGHGQAGSIHRQNLQLSACNNNASNGECSNTAGTSCTMPSTNLGRGGRVQSQVWPTRVISGPQPNHSNSCYCYGLNQSLSSQPFFPYYYPPDCFCGNYNYSASAIDSRWQALFPPRAADQTYQPLNYQQLLGSYNYSHHFAWNTYGYAGMYHNTPAYGYGGTDPMNLMGYGGRDSLNERTQEAAQFLLDEEDNLDLSLHL